MTAALVAGTGRKVVVLERSSRAGRPGHHPVERGSPLQPRAARALLPRAGLPAASGTGSPLHGRVPRCATRRLDRREPIVRDPARHRFGARVAAAHDAREARFLRLFATLPPAGCPPVRPRPARRLDRETAGVGNLARLIRTLCRVSTYVDDAAAAVRRGGDRPVEARHSQGGVWYLDGGWQALVDGLRDRLRERASSSGRVAGRRRSAATRTGSRWSWPPAKSLRGRTAVLAIDPEGAVDLLDRRIDAPPGELDGGVHPGPGRLPRRRPEPPAAPAPAAWPSAWTGRCTTRCIRPPPSWRPTGWRSST